MRGQMMDFQLTLPHILRRVETYYPDKQVVTRLPDPDPSPTTRSAFVSPSRSRTATRTPEERSSRT